MLCGLYTALIPQLLQNTIQAELSRGHGNCHNVSVGTPLALLLKVYIRTFQRRFCGERLVDLKTRLVTSTSISPSKSEGRPHSLITPSDRVIPVSPVFKNYV